jgi:hypothetical protein
MAAHAAVQSQHEPFFDHTFAWVDTDSGEDDGDAWQRARLHAHLRACGVPL